MRSDDGQVIEVVNNIDLTMNDAKDALGFISLLLLVAHLIKEASHHQLLVILAIPMKSKHQCFVYWLLGGVDLRYCGQKYGWNKVEVCLLFPCIIAQFTTSHHISSRRLLLGLHFRIKI